MVNTGYTQTTSYSEKIIVSGKDHKFRLKRILIETKLFMKKYQIKQTKMIDYLIFSKKFTYTYVCIILSKFLGKMSFCSNSSSTLGLYFCYFKFQLFILTRISNWRRLNFTNPANNPLFHQGLWGQKLHKKLVHWKFFHMRATFVLENVTSWLLCSFFQKTNRYKRNEVQS